jgi:hypothetical protein
MDPSYDATMFSVLYSRCSDTHFFQRYCFHSSREHSQRYNIGVVSQKHVFSSNTFDGEGYGNTAGIATGHRLKD